MTQPTVSKHWRNTQNEGRDGQKKKIGKSNERKGKVKRGQDEEVNGQAGRGVARPHTGRHGSDDATGSQYSSMSLYAQRCTHRSRRRSQAMRVCVCVLRLLLGLRTQYCGVHGECQGSDSVDCRRRAGSCAGVGRLTLLRSPLVSKVK